jgi:small subunit ribosomal protein S33
MNMFSRMNRISTVAPLARSTLTLKPFNSFMVQMNSMSTIQNAESEMKIKLSSSLKAHIKESGDRIFGNRPIVPYRTGYKYLLQKPYGPIAMHYYMKDSTKSFKKMSSEYQSEEDERRSEKLHRMRRKGKGPPKKGQGKRATKAAAKGGKK